MSAKPKPDLCAVNSVIKERWVILDKLGSGGFGQVYLAEDTTNKRRVAIKCESVKAPRCILKLEAVVLKDLRGESCIPRFFACGRTPELNFVVMSQLGPSLGTLRKQTQQQLFSVHTVSEIAIQTLSAIKCVHDRGVLHRDIKPSNFAIGCTPATRTRIFLFDFGLSRIYRVADGSVRLPRKKAGFRGTSRYASINAHLSRELGRRDDIWSLFYMLVELSAGMLPWRKAKVKADIARIKQTISLDKLLHRVPSIMKPCFQSWHGQIESLKYADRPDYDAYTKLFQDLLTSVIGNSKPALDWEEVSSEGTTQDPVHIESKKDSGKRSGKRSGRHAKQEPNQSVEIKGASVSPNEQKPIMTGNINPTSHAKETCQEETDNNVVKHILPTNTSIPTESKVPANPSTFAENSAANFLTDIQKVSPDQGRDDRIVASDDPDSTTHDIHNPQQQLEDSHKSSNNVLGLVSALNLLKKTLGEGNISTSTLSTLSLGSLSISLSSSSSDFADVSSSDDKNVANHTSKSEPYKNFRRDFTRPPRFGSTESCLSAGTLNQLSLSSTLTPSEPVSSSLTSHSDSDIEISRKTDKLPTLTAKPHISRVTWSQVMRQPKLLGQTPAPRPPQKKLGKTSTVDNNREQISKNDQENPRIKDPRLRRYIKQT
eukprot:m.69336 g.69336  ORF g.69336 m.69336 type:complete len:656 (-) comp12046_c0_seq1:113-2080(-)